jgi:hypothetical protein
MEILSDFVFFTMTDHVSPDASTALGFPAGDTVGEPLTVTWSYNIPPA